MKWVRNLAEHFLSHKLLNLVKDNKLSFRARIAYSRVGIAEEWVIQCLGILNQYPVFIVAFSSVLFFISLYGTLYHRYYLVAFVYVSMWISGESLFLKMLFHCFQSKTIDFIEAIYETTIAIYVYTKSWWADIFQQIDLLQ